MSISHQQRPTPVTNLLFIINGEIKMMERISTTKSNIFSLVTLDFIFFAEKLVSGYVQP
jgi:hypothetical protein